MTMRAQMSSVLALAACFWLFPQTASAQDVTYAEDVAPILNENCVTCHRPGEVAPMSLLTYDDARSWARSIGEEGSATPMPPWHAAFPTGLRG